MDPELYSSSLIVIRYSEWGAGGRKGSKRYCWSFSHLILVAFNDSWQFIWVCSAGRTQKSNSKTYCPQLILHHTPENRFWLSAPWGPGPVFLHGATASRLLFPAFGRSCISSAYRLIFYLYFWWLLWFSVLIIYVGDYWREMGFELTLPMWLRYGQFALLLRTMIWNQLLERKLLTCLGMHLNLKLRAFLLPNTGAEVFTRYKLCLLIHLIFFFPLKCQSNENVVICLLSRITLPSEQEKLGGTSLFFVQDT